jgi:hypothetical protein
MNPLPPSDLIDALVDMQVADRAKIEKALETSKEKNRPFQTLMAEGGVAPSVVLDALCAVYGLPRAPQDLVAKADQELFDEDWDRTLFWRFRAMPFFRKGRHLWIAFCDVDHVLDAQTFGLPEHRPFLTFEHLVVTSLSRILGQRPEVDTLLTGQPGDLDSFEESTSGVWASSKAQGAVIGSADPQATTEEIPLPQSKSSTPPTSDEKSGMAAEEGKGQRKKKV